MHLTRAVNAPLFTLDIGTNSVGWAVFDLGRNSGVSALLAAGSRIFHEGRAEKDHTTLNATRRMRRLVARRLQRRARQVKALAAFLRAKGLLPERGTDAALLARCPYTLRAAAARAPAQAHDLGRALIHMAKHRGYDSRRRFSNAEEGKIVGPRIETLREALGRRTLSEFLLDRMKAGEPARFKPGSPFYPSREMVRAEFDLIRTAQSGWHGLTDADWERLATLMFFRRPLKPAKPGQCVFLPEEERAPKALPSVQEAIFLEAVTNLRLKEVPHHPRTRSLSPAEVALIADRCTGLANIELRTLRQWLDLPPNARFTIELDRGGSKGRKSLVVDRTGPTVRPMLGTAWDNGDAEWKDAVAAAWLIPNEEDAAGALARLSLDAVAIDWLLQLPPPDGRHGFSAPVIRRVLPHLRAGLGMAKALEKEGFSASDVPSLDRLPYYGQILAGHTQPVLPKGACAEDERRWGRIPNPTIHIVLNQLRRVVNELIAVYGRPAEIVVETTRDLKLGAEKLRQLANRQAARERDNCRYDEMAEQVLGPAAGSTRRDRRLRLMLWERQNRICMYSLQDRPIPLAAALDGAITEIDHVLPRSKTLDDGLDNLVLVYKTENQKKKGERAPWEAFPEEQRELICERAERLRTQNRSKGFSRELMRRLGPEGPEMLNGRDWLGRQLGDTGYAARVARIYLSTLVRKEAVRLVPGKVTAHIRRQLDLSKSREDHRHHALDAICLGLVDWRVLTALHTASGQSRDLPEVFVPIAGFDDAAREMIERIVVSHRRNRGSPRSLHGLHGDSTTGEMHRETARSPVEFGAGMKLIRHHRADGTVLEKAVETNGNAYLEIYRRADGSTGGELVSTFDANRIEAKPGGRLRPYQPRWVREQKGARLAMRLFKGDTVVMRGDDGMDGYWIVREAKKDGDRIDIILTPHHLALDVPAAKKRRDGSVRKISPTTVDKYGLHLAYVDPLGQVNRRRTRWSGSSTSPVGEPR